MIEHSSTSIKRAHIDFVLLTLISHSRTSLDLVTVEELHSHNMEATQQSTVSDSGITFGKLSSEILILIFSFLPRDINLVQTALVSKRFCDCMEPFLYQNINVLIPCPLAGDEV